MSRDHPARSRGAAAASRAFDPRELALARKLRGMRKNELARSVGVTPAALSQFVVNPQRISIRLHRQERSGLSHPHPQLSPL